MVRKQRKLKYYQLSMIDTKNEAVLDCPDTEVRFNEIVNKNMIPIIGTSHKVVQIELSDGSYFIEFIKQDNHVWYIKLGVANPTNSIAIRDKGTLESNSLEIDPTKSLEINTFCIIDFETRILSYVGMNGSPRVSILKDWLNRENSVDGVATQLAVIYSHDVLNELSKKKRVIKIGLDVAVPSDKSLEYLDTKENTFEKLNGKLTRTVSFVFRAERGRTIFDDPKIAEQTIRAVLDGTEVDSIEAFYAHGIDEGETTPQRFDLLDFSYTVTDKLDRLVYDRSDDEKRMDMIFEAYRGKKAELRQCIR